MLDLQCVVSKTRTFGAIVVCDCGLTNCVFRRFCGLVQLLLCDCGLSNCVNMVSSIAVVGKIDFKCVRLHVQTNLRFKVHLSCDVAIGFVIFVLRFRFFAHVAVMLRCVSIVCVFDVFGNF